jgi:hypothetical protein
MPGRRSTTYSIGSNGQNTSQKPTNGTWKSKWPWQKHNRPNAAGEGNAPDAQPLDLKHVASSTAFAREYGGEVVAEPNSVSPLHHTSPLLPPTSTPTPIRFPASQQRRRTLPVPVSYSRVILPPTRQPDHAQPTGPSRLLGIPQTTNTPQQLDAAHPISLFQQLGIPEAEASPQQPVNSQPPASSQPKALVASLPSKKFRKIGPGEFVYDNLEDHPLHRDHKDLTRILTVLPGGGDIIRCILDVQQIPSLDERGKVKKMYQYGKEVKLEPFDALSYAWGSANMPNEIQVRKQNDEEFKTLKVTESLYSALRALRYDDEPRRFWADAVCIYVS